MVKKTRENSIFSEGSKVWGTDSDIQGILGTVNAVLNPSISDTPISVIFETPDGVVHRCYRLDGKRKSSNQHPSLFLTTEKKVSFTFVAPAL